MSDALQDYMRGDLTTREIASKYGVSQSTLTVWATNAGIPLRNRGRQKMQEPTARQKQILEMAEIQTLHAVGARFGMTKQGVQRIVKRWSNWMKPKRPPFKPGDVLHWNGQEITVLSAGLSNGMVMDASGRTMHLFPWNHAGRLPKIVGFNDKYAETSAGVLRRKK